MAEKDTDTKSTSTSSTSSGGSTAGGQDATSSVRTGSASTEAGFYGTATDPTPREHYTATGVTGSKPTPETDSKAAQAAREARG